MDLFNKNLIIKILNNKKNKLYKIQKLKIKILYLLNLKMVHLVTFKLILSEIINIKANYIAN